MKRGRRLILLVAWLAVFDQFVPTVLGRIEHERYERGEVARFENSDLFALGPLVTYLREQPRGDRPRVAFIGNSVLWGYGLPASDALPAQFQAIEPQERALNIAINGLQFGSSYLITKAIAGSVDRLYIQIADGGAPGQGGIAAHRLLPSLIPVDESDRQWFELPAPGNADSYLRDVMAVWQLYRTAYRIQAALFGSSTRQYLYMHKGEIARSLLGRLPFDPPPRPVIIDEDGPIDVSAPRALEAPSESRRLVLRTRFPVLWNLEELAQRRQKRIVFLQFNDRTWGLEERDIAELNAEFAPFGEIVHVSVPVSMTTKGLHLTALAGRRVAEALLKHEQQRKADGLH